MILIEFTVIIVIVRVCIIKVTTTRQTHDFKFHGKLSEQLKEIYFRQIRLKEIKNLAFGCDLDNIRVRLTCDHVSERLNTQARIGS